MREYKASEVINGTFGEMWLDGDYMAETKGCKAIIEIKYDAVSRVRKLMDGQKMTGIEGKGEVKLDKVSSYITQKMSSKLKAGKTPSFTIVTKLDDPDALGAERVALYGCKFDRTILAEWERKKIGEESYNFTFEDWDPIDLIGEK